MAGALSPLLGGTTSRVVLAGGIVEPELLPVIRPLAWGLTLRSEAIRAVG